MGSQLLVSRQLLPYRITGGLLVIRERSLVVILIAAVNASFLALLPQGEGTGLLLRQPLIEPGHSVLCALADIHGVVEPMAFARIDHKLSWHLVVDQVKSKGIESQTARFQWKTRFYSGVVP
jgi:hypothetical protein